MAGTVREEAVKLKKNITDLYTKAVDHATLPLNRRGTMVTCEPLEGYPMKVTADAEATTITRCGKNLFDKSESKLSRLSYNSSGGSKVEIFGFELILPPGTYVLKAQSKSSAKEGYIYGLTYDISGTYLGEWNAAWGTDLTAKIKTFTNVTRVIIYDAVNTPANGAYVSYAWATFNNWNIQLEVGNTATEYEPYNGDTFNPGDTIPALPGVNYIFADAGEITVEARVGALELANTIAPAFTETGSIVTCEPVEGYHLTVTADAATTITRCGKNLLEFKNPYQVGYYSASGTTLQKRTGWEFYLPPGTYTFSATKKNASVGDVYMYGFVVDSNNRNVSGKSLSLVTGKSITNKTVSIVSGEKVMLYDGIGEWQTASAVTKLFNEDYVVQCETGNTATAFEPHTSETFNPDEVIPALPGVNTIFADTGTVTVTGRADPLAIINKLQSASV